MTENTIVQTSKSNISILTASPKPCSFLSDLVCVLYFMITISRATTKP